MPFFGFGHNYSTVITCRFTYLLNTYISTIILNRIIDPIKANTALITAMVVISDGINVVRELSFIGCISEILTEEGVDNKFSVADVIVLLVVLGSEVDAALVLVKGCDVDSVIRINVVAEITDADSIVKKNFTCQYTHILLLTFIA